MKKLNLHCEGLFLPMKATFKQASSVRKVGESVWVVARRASHIGLGEGCPRLYVTGEQVGGCLKWLAVQLPRIEQECSTLEELQHWVNEQRAIIDQHPAAWCAVETALLDLLARENGQSVEGLLGWGGLERRYSYTAVLSDGDEKEYLRMLNAYLGAGFSNFKIKLCGEFEKDRQKIALLLEAWSIGNMHDKAPSIRLDANNLWQGQPEQAIRYLNQLGDDFWAIEEPVAPKAFDQLSRISIATSKTIILDESLCTIDDLKQLQIYPGEFTANIKVSRVGGVLRALELVKMIQAMGLKIIVGAHVAETSIMTRAGMLVAQAAGEHLIGQEGGYGTMLLDREPVFPSLVFGYGGIIDLTEIKEGKMAIGTASIYSENWKSGWGLSPVIVRD